MPSPFSSYISTIIAEGKTRLSFMSCPSSSRHLSVSGWIDDAKPHRSAMAQSCCARSALGLLTKTWASFPVMGGFLPPGWTLAPILGCRLVLRRSRWQASRWNCAALQRGGVHGVRASECWERGNGGLEAGTTSGSTSAAPDPSPASRARRVILYRKAPCYITGGLTRLKMRFGAIGAPGARALPKQCPNARDVTRCELGVCCASRSSARTTGTRPRTSTSAFYRRAKPVKPSGQLDLIQGYVFSKWQSLRHHLRAHPGQAGHDSKISEF